MEYKCDICNKKYSSYQSKWIHHKKFHSKIENENTKISCKFCNKLLSCKQSKWRHEKTCKNTNNLVTIDKLELKSLQNKINNLDNNKSKTINNINKNKSKTINNINKNINKNNNTNNGIINNITINAVGKEPIDSLTVKDIKKLSMMNLNAYAYIIEKINFNKNQPENHNFCTTSLEGNYINYYNKKTNRIDKMNKVDFLDTTLLSAIEKINDLLFYLEFNMKEEYNEKINESHYEKLQEIALKSQSMIDKYKKSYHTNINELSYNNKEIVLDTWLKLKPSDDDDPQSDDSSIVNYKYALDLDDSDKD